MPEFIILSVFCLSLLVCIFTGISVIYSLAFSLLLFVLYAKIRGHSNKNILDMCFEGIAQMKTILLVFALIGMITAIWKASGTIAYIIVTSSNFINAKIFVLASFLLCAFLSILIGTSFGTAATMGVICISMARSMGINEMLVAGAIISGIFYGDRCSPMSTSALLVSQVTRTNIFTNIRYMIKTALVPTIITIVIYYILGLKSTDKGLDFTIINLIESNFNLNLYLILPALVIIVFSIFRIDVKITMSISILLAIIFSLIFQKESFYQIFRYLIFGYRSNNPDINALFKGGGIISMLGPTVIILIASCYAGIFEKTGLLNGLKSKIRLLADKTNEFFAIFMSGIFTNMISCNQSLATILTYQLCKGFKSDQELAIDIENTTILMASWVPWSIALAVSAKTLNVDTSAVIFAFYVYILPLYHLLLSILNKN
jgi:NhaC family Na+:H+ antiporter